MKDRIDSFLDLPLLYRAGAIVCVLSLLVVGIYYFSFMADIQRIEDMDSQRADLQKQIQSLRIKASRLPEFELEVERLDIELDKALRELPDKKEIDTLLAKISDKAKDVGLDVVLFKPEGEQKKDFYAEVPVSLEVHGTFHQVASFFDEVAHMERIVNMTQFKIENHNQEESDTLKTYVIATSFRFLDESERPSEDKKNKKKRRRR